MEKYSTRGLLSLLIIAVVFMFGSFIKITNANTRGTMTSPVELIELLINIGVISPEKAGAARAAVAVKPVVVVKPLLPPNNYPTVTLGGTDVVTLACDIKKINLDWTTVDGKPYSDIRIDDETLNGWGGKSGGIGWCAGYDGGGDLCQNSLSATSPWVVYPVQAGHSYRYWISSYDATGAASTTRSMTFSVSDSCISSSKRNPVITLGSTPTGATTTCNAKKIDLAWTPVSGMVYNNIRVDDTTANGWGNKTGGLTWCKGFNGDGDLCDNGLTSNTRKDYPVQAGHSYHFWVHSTDINGIASTTRTMNFSVPVCLTTATTTIPYGDDDLIVCASDLKKCSDGTSVGRTGENCEFVCPVVTPKPPVINNTISTNEVWCSKGDWKGKNSVIGMWWAKDLKRQDDARFLCHTDKNIYRCTNDTDERANGGYWNTFSTRIGDKAPTPNYTCDMSQGKWVPKTSASIEISSNYAAAVTSWDAVLRLIQALR